MQMCQVQFFSPGFAKKEHIAFSAEAFLFIFSEIHVYISKKAEVGQSKSAFSLLIIAGVLVLANRTSS